MNEFSPLEKIDKALQSVQDYCNAALRSPIVKKAMKRGDKEIYRRVNTPDKVPAVYAMSLFNKLYYTRSFAVLEGRDGDAFASRVMCSSGAYKAVVIHSHAIKRYIERHHFEGTLEQAQRKILTTLGNNARIPDNMSESSYIDFDGGVFLCIVKDKILHFNTFIMHRQCKPDQRLRALKSEKMTKELNEEFERLTRSSNPQEIQQIL